MLEKTELVDMISDYNPNVDTDLIKSAYDFGFEKHGDQMRQSGDPYFSHPLAVANILVDMRLDLASVITAMLHDTVEDTDATLDEIEEKFGKDVAKLVDGVTKLTKIEFQTAQSKQAENFRKLVLAMSEDIRVLLVKLADRLHNMRTLHFTPEEKQRRIALETLEIYVPLAERIGVHAFKEELEDIAFGILNREASESIEKRLNYLRSEGEGIVDKVINRLTDDLKDTGIDFNISGREKSIRSGAKCSAKISRSNSFQTSWLFVASCRPSVIAIISLVSCITNIRPYRDVLRTISRCRKTTAIAAFTPQ